MNNITKKALESKGIKVNNSDVDNVIFSNDKSDSFFLEISEGCFGSTRLLLIKRYDNIEEFKDADAFVDENYIDERLYAIKDTLTDDSCEIDLYGFIKWLFELIAEIDTREELIEFLDDINQEWLFQR